MTVRPIVRTKHTCHGAARYAGTRIPVDIVCRNLPTMGEEWLEYEYGLTVWEIEAGWRWCRRPDNRLRRWLTRKRGDIANWAYDTWGDG